MNRKVIGFLFILLSFEARAQDSLSVNTNENYYNLSLEELMNIKISVASVKELTLRESPGIVTLITSDDIKNLGARYLMDVLRVVPGFDFGVDVEGVVGIGVRGNWAHEGKILIQIDGQQMNENLYSTTQLENHYPLNNVDRIEIIRGPGSAIYGDCAEYAVINIISKRGKDLEGGEVSAFYGLTSKSVGHRNIGVSIGEEQKGFSYDFSSTVAELNGTSNIYTDVFGNSYDLTNQSAIKNVNVNLGLNIKDFQFRAIVDNYNLETRDAYQQILTRAYPLRFDSYFLELKKEARINRKLSITPKLNYKNQTPWAFDGVSVDDEFDRFKINSQQFLGNLIAVYDYSSRINLIAGTEYIKNIATQEAPEVFQTTLTNKLSYDNAAVFVQALFNNRFGSFTAGARYNYNSRYAASFVPRFGFTKAINMFHIKLLFSKAFRAPNTENIDLNPDIKPENTSVFEIETGYEINTKMLLTLNAFYISTKDPIIYYYDELLSKDAYANYEKSGTRGFEIEYKYKSVLGYIGLNYSFYIPNENALPSYCVPNNADALLAFSPHKINLTGGIKFSKHIHLNTSVGFSGPRYGIVAFDNVTNESTVKKFNPLALVNLNLSYDDLFTKGLNAAVGVYNLLGSKDYYIQPYNSLHAPLPAMSKEFAIKISYAISFKKNK